MQNQDGHVQSAAQDKKLKLSLENQAKSFAPVTQNDFGDVVKHVGMSRSATSATQNDATRRLKPPEVTTFAALPIGPAIAESS